MKNLKSWGWTPRPEEVEAWRRQEVGNADSAVAIQMKYAQNAQRLQNMLGIASILPKW